MTIPNDLDPQIQEMLKLMADLNIPKIQDLEPEAARMLVEAMADKRRESYPSPEVADVVDTTTGPDAGDIPIRIYRASADGVQPGLVFFHGGGHVISSLNGHDTMARFMCRTTGCTVVSIDYRMGPEDPFPAAVEDAYQAAVWVASEAETLQIDPMRIALTGDSAGGNLATVVALMARDAGQEFFSAQVLVYPVTDYRGGRSSHERYGVGYGILEDETVSWFRDHYLARAEDVEDWRCSPLLASSLAGLPPALVITAECDVLKDEGVAYYERLKADGVAAEYIDYPGMIHGFFGYLGQTDMAEQAHQDVAAYLQRLWK
ncbi:MAG: alpha/beta hydrolase [Pseudomonadota bacterium]